MTSRLENMQKQRDQLNARINAERAKHAKKQRAEDTRRKVLTGAAVMKAVEAGEMSEHELNEILKRHLSRENERKFMGIE